VIFLILLICLFLPKKLFAAPEISIINLPNEVQSGLNFPLSFFVTNTNIGGTYYYKFFGGIGESTSTFKTSNTLSYNSAWINFPKFTSDLGGSAIVDTTAYVIPEAISGINNFKIRIALTSNTSSGVTSPFYPLNIVIPSPTPTKPDLPEPTIAVVTPLPTLEITPLVSPLPTMVMETPLIITEIMANPNTGEPEWIEIYNPSSIAISLEELCLYDASNHSRCLPKNAILSSNSYYSYTFSSGFLNNDGDIVIFQNNSVIYPKSPKNLTYSLQTNNSWCFSESSQNAPNKDCSSITSNSTDDKYIPPLVNLQFIPSFVNAGDDFNLVLSLNSADLYSLRLTYPFGSQYFPFSNYHDGYSWLTLPLSVSKKMPEGRYPLSFHLKKNGSSHLYDYQMGELNIKPAIVTPKASKSKVLGVSTSCPQCIDNSANVNYYPASTLRKVLPDANFFSWPFLFAGSILFLSPILFPKLYSD